MAKLKALIDELVTANRILVNEGIVDSFGHVSVRHPKDDKLFLLSRARAPELVETKDVLAYTLDGEPADAKKANGLAPYIERSSTAPSTRRGPTFTQWCTITRRARSRSVSPAIRCGRCSICAPRSGTRCRCGIRKTGSATLRCW